MCAKCGARTKADREWCLRCEAPLVRARSSELQLPAWIRKLGGGTLIFSIVGALVLLLIGYTVWDRMASQDASASIPASQRAPAAQTASVASGPTVSPWSATSLDVRRKGAPEPTGPSWPRPGRGTKRRFRRTRTTRKR